ncbi:hypothetical protein AGMMS49983_14700 [Clostridia bacterium]|nr:hypothetical protein AGMMS49983_14700 [Clostridia bacterium]
MKKKLLAVIVVVLMLVTVFAGCAKADAPAAPAPAPADSGSSAAAPAAEEPAAGGKTFGYLAWALSDEWNAYGNEAFIWCAEQDGNTVITLDCQKDPESQVSQAEELINKGVDGISIFPCSPEAGATIVRMANEAGIPIAVENIFLPDDASAGEVVGQVACQYGDIGYAAVEYAAKTWPGAKLLYVHGGPGVGVYEDYKIGVDKALEDYKSDIELVGLVNGNWETEASYNVTMDFITSGKSDFDVVFANNDLQAVGVYNALKENGMEDIPVLSTGGSEQGYAMIKDGQEYANMTAPVNIQGIIVYQFLAKATSGQTVAQKKIPLPVIPVDTTNIDTAWIKWSDNDAASAYVTANVPELAR